VLDDEDLPRHVAGLAPDFCPTENFAVPLTVSLPYLFLEVLDRSERHFEKTKKFETN